MALTNPHNGNHHHRSARASGALGQGARPTPSTDPPEARGQADRHSDGHTRATAEVTVISARLHRLAEVIPVRDFVWMRAALDAVFDDILHGRAL